MRDRRWDFLYDRQRQPVKAYVLARFAEELAAELAAWPPPSLEWSSDEARVRYGEGAAERPRDDVLRFSLELARLDLAREWEELDRRRAAEAYRLQTPAEEAALHLLVRLLTERCLALKEHASSMSLSRPELASALVEVERRLFRVTPA